MERSIQFPWQVPFGELSLKLDPLSMVFLVAVAILAICAGIYAFGYMRPYRKSKSLGPHIFFYLIFVLALVLIITANNVILFLGAWETMTISAYFLIIFYDEQSSVRKAGFIYLIAYVIDKIKTKRMINKSTERYAGILK